MKTNAMAAERRDRNMGQILARRAVSPCSKRFAVHPYSQCNGLARYTRLSICFRQSTQRLNDVQATLRLGSARPASCPGIFARPDGARAMRATNTGIILIVE